MKRGLIALAIQLAASFAAAFITGVLPYLFYGALSSQAVRTLTTALQWSIMPLFGAVSAYFVTRRGVNQYLSWLLPPSVYSAAPWLLLGYPPSAGVMLTTSLVSVVGAAAGAVRNRSEKTSART